MRVALLTIPAIVLCSAGTAGAGPTRPSAAFREQVEADWILQERYRHAPEQSVAPLTTRQDAAGGCDGVKDGTYGFHTSLEADPWWQVDLGSVQPVNRVVIWNRCDAVSERAFRLKVLLSAGGNEWRTVYTRDGAAFGGVPDGKPLAVSLAGAAARSAQARFVRIQLAGKTYLHLDEIEVFGPADPARNLALHRVADQSSTSRWSTAKMARSDVTVEWARRTGEILERSGRLLDELRESGIRVDGAGDALRKLRARLAALPAADPPQEASRDLYVESRWLQRKLTLSLPVLDFDAIVFTQRVPGSFNHMSDQYLGWWSRPGGGIHILRDFRGDSPRVQCLTESFREPGSFLRPILSYDARKVLFAWCRHYPNLAGEQNKLDKDNVPEDAFYHIFEMGIDGTGVRQLTHGKYDDFDARYLPEGRIVFLSTRRGQSIQCGIESARRTLVRDDLPDIYVRCGGGPERPCAVYTLHTMDPDGGNICAISPFEMFEWTPSVAADGTILYSRWDYVDRDNMPYMSLWSIHPDGTNARLVYGNYSKGPHCTFEPRSIPGSDKIIFTASGHHSQTMGSLVLLDPAVGDDGPRPITRLTPEVAFPEIEGWPLTSYSTPWPLSERFCLVAWGAEGAAVPGPSGWARWHAVLRPKNGTGLYFFDAKGGLELLYRDPAISSCSPLPLRPRPRPPVLAPLADREGPMEGRFLLTDVYRGLTRTPRGTVKALRIVAVPPKTHPTMNHPSIGVTRDDPGKCVLGTVPVEADGSAYFRAPAGVIVFFQALDARGMAVQTMRSATHVQPGQTLGCAGCHEGRNEAPAVKFRPIAAARSPSRIKPGPEGSWPLRFDRLVKPVLERKCVRCHRPDGDDPDAARFVLGGEKAYETLTGYAGCGRPSLRDHVLASYRRGRSVERACPAATSALLAKLTAGSGHHGLTLEADDFERLITWMDTYAQKAGFFDAAQERRLVDLRLRSKGLLAE